MSELNSNSVLIREVWNYNLEKEFELIRNIVDHYPLIAMDTEFPGIVLRTLRTYKNLAERNYDALKLNVDILKLIQLGITFADEQGNLPTCGTEKFCIWQFNFREFNQREDVYAKDSIDLLTRSGIDFVRNRQFGVDALKFSELLISSGLVLNDDVRWITFHSGYDFAYLVKLLTCKRLPETLTEFLKLFKVFFPVVYDIKYLTRFSNTLHGGLNRIAELLGVKRVGVCHQAGSDSLLTLRTFLKLNDHYAGSFWKDFGVLYGLQEI